MQLGFCFRSLVLVLILALVSPALGDPLFRQMHVGGVGPKKKHLLLLHQIDALCRQYCANHKMTGLAVAVIGQENGKSFDHIATFGTVSKKSSVPITPYTEFRIGPLTQLFTAQVLAYFIQLSQVSLNDPISRFVSKSTRLPSYQGKTVTLGDLATHTSGLPNMPYSLSEYGHFQIGQMYRFLSLYKLPSLPGTSYHYSHFGYAVLAHLLARVGKKPFSDLVDQIVLTPLNLRDTGFCLSEEQKLRSAVGYQKEQGISPVDKGKTFSTLIGASGLYSTIGDMAVYLSFQLGREPTSLNTLLPLIQHSYYQGEDGHAALAWQVLPKRKGKQKLYLQGGVGGFSSYMAILPTEKMGIALLCNQQEAQLDLLAHDVLQLLHKMP